MLCVGQAGRKIELMKLTITDVALYCVVLYGALVLRNSINPFSGDPKTTMPSDSCLLGDRANPLKYFLCLDLMDN